MILHKNSLSNRFYSLFYDKNIDHETPNFCDWAWMYIFALISLPLTWITLVSPFYGCRSNVEKLFTRLLTGILVQFLIGIYISGLIYRTKGTLMVTGVIVALCVGIFLFAFSMEKFIDWKSNKPEKKSIIFEAVKSYKEKYCPKIEWK